VKRREEKEGHGKGGAERGEDVQKEWRNNSAGFGG